MIRRIGMAFALAALIGTLSAGVALGTTPEQISRGSADYATNCSGCHGSSGEGGFGPALLGPGTMSGFGSVRALYQFASTSMPRNAPGSLESQTYLDIISWLLSQRGVEPDGQELSAATLDGTPLNPAAAAPTPAAPTPAPTPAPTASPAPTPAPETPGLPRTGGAQPLGALLGLGVGVVALAAAWRLRGLRRT